MNRRSAIKRTAISMAAFAAAPMLRAENWPARPITMVLPASAGSGTDLMARELANRLSIVLKQPVVVDNKPGASGIIGTQQVVRAVPDGYTILYTNGTNTVMAPALLKTMPYDVQRDLQPVAQTAVGGVFLLASNDLPAKNLQELIAYVKANPRKLGYGSWAVGSSGHLTMEWLKRQTGMEIEHVPYRQVPQLLTDLVSGQLKIGWADPAAPLPFIESGRIRAIAVTGKARLPRSPNVPTLGEQGHAFDSVGWFGVFAPQGTPKAILQRLNEEIVRIQEQPEMAARSASMNVGVPTIKTPEQFRDVVARDLQLWKKIVTDANITVEN